ncbi:hypothetical protein AB0M29_44640 [Streptomyces sp. NPDC051976]|uniref:hypothetical protein n=1 Tax=Streptomyces sp. NPDC051976 TaxID=3154947 RepID=UPI00343E9FB1
MNSFERLLHDLEGAGQWRGVSHDRASALRARLRSGQDATWSSGGAWCADGEDLADGDVEDWLRGMTEPLSAWGVQLVVTTCSSPHGDGLDSYTVKVNGEMLDLYSVDPADPSLPLAYDPWLDCTIKPAAEVNCLLLAAASDCRVAVFWPGGNDGLSVLGPESVLRAAAVATQAADGVSAFVVPRPAC